MTTRSIRFRIAEIATATAIVAGFILGSPSLLADDLDEIRTAVFDYFDGINEVDRARMERAFDPSAALKNVDKNGALSVQPIAEVIERWAKKEPAARRGEILSIDVTDGEIARVVFDYDGAYTDFLTLARINGQWKIIDKVFVTH